MKAVVLAAGFGSRLGESTTVTPKPLVRFAGRPLIGHTLDALGAAGMSEVVVVTGFGSGAVEEQLGRERGVPLRTVSNEAYWLKAGMSLRTAQGACGREPFLLLMADHAVDLEFVTKLRASEAVTPDDSCRVAADFGEWPEGAAGKKAGSDPAWNGWRTAGCSISRNKARNCETDRRLVY